MSISTWATALLLLGTIVLTFAVRYRDDHLLVSACVLLCIIVAAAPRPGSGIRRRLIGVAAALTKADIDSGGL
jgi:hypothetical protein